MDGDRGGAHAPAGTPGLSARARTVVLACLGVAVVTALLLATSHGIQVAHLPQRDVSRPSAVSITSREVLTNPAQPSAPPRTGSSGTLATVLAVILAGVMLVVVIAVLRLLWLRLADLMHRSRRAHPEQDGGEDQLEPVRSRLTAERELHLDALAAGPPADAVVACWVALERSVADAGVNRGPAETSAELTMRVLTDLDVDATAVSALAALYREARFSDHALTEDDRSRARAALENVHAGLGVMSP